MSLLREKGGRLRTGWRLGVFVVLTLVGIFFLEGIAALLSVLQGPSGAVVRVTLTFTLALLVASWIVMEKLEKTPVAALGLPLDDLAWRELLGGFQLGAGVILLAVGLLTVTGSVTWTLDPEGLRPGALLWNALVVTLFLGVAALAEELLFRGYPLQASAEAAGGPVAVVATSLLFGVMHAWNPGAGSVALETGIVRLPLPLVNITLAGLLLGVAYWRTYSLWYATGAHLGWNWLMGFATDLPVSGLEAGRQGYAFLDTPGFEASLQGPGLWVGGSFGPEGGLAVTLATVAGLIWLLRTRRLDRSLRVRALDPLPDRRGRTGESRTREAGPPAGSEPETPGGRRSG